VDSNARSKTWHDVKTNARGKKMEEYLVSRQLHIINEECFRPTFFNCRRTSNIDLTLTNNNLLAKVCEWEISNEDSLSDHNYIQYTIREGGAKTQNMNYKNQGIRFIIKEEKLHTFDQNLVKEMWKTAHNEQTEGGPDELDKYLSTRIITEYNLEQQIELISEAIQSACYGTFRYTTNRKKKNNKKTVPWWTDKLTTLRKRVNAYRRLFQRTKNNEKLREDRKKNYGEAKRTYQTEVKKRK
jgi:hypothetical protein